MTSPEPSAVGVLDEATLESARRLTLLINAISRRFDAAVTAEGYGQLTSNNDMIVLGDLFQHGSRRPGSLCEVTGLTSGGLSLLLDRLEDAGLVTRSLGGITDDRRAVVVDLTESGATTIGRIGETVEQVVAELGPLLDEFASLLDTFPIPAEKSSRVTVVAESAVGRMCLLTRLGNEVIADLADENYDADVSQARTAVVLCRAAEPGGTRPRDLVTDTGLSRSGVTQFLQGLEAAGLIERVAGRLSDRRAVSITLTSDGRRSLGTRLARMARQSRPARNVLTALRSQIEPVQVSPHDETVLVERS